MSFYLTCRNCLHETEDCARRNEVAAKIKGIGLTAIKFRCVERADRFQPGQRVTVSWPVYTEDWSYQDGYSLESWPATVSNKSAKGFVVRVDDVDSDHGTPAREYVKAENLYCNVSPRRLAALDEPARAVCQACGNVALADGRVDRCELYDGDYVGRKCLNAELAKEQSNA